MNVQAIKTISARTMCASAAMLGAASLAGAATIRVPADQPTIQAAINATRNGDTVLVADGVFTGPGNFNISLGGKAITVRSEHGPASTIIDIQATQALQRTGFIFANNETAGAVVDGFTIKRGYQFNGAAIQITGAASPIIRNSVFTENHSDCWGAAVYFDGTTTAMITNCKFTHNFSGDDGGAIFGLSGSPTISNCEISNNQGSSTGGAITIFGTGSPKLVNSTIVGNSAFYGPAVYANNLQIVNSIIWGNISDIHQPQLYSWSGSAVLDVKYSIVQGGYAGTGNLSVAPQFVDAANGDFHLVRNSPGIDGGDLNMVVPPGAVDMDGDPRIFGVRIDIGIDEFRRPGDVNGDHMVNVDDLLAVLNGWGPAAADNPANFNHDGAINVDDLLILIGNWG